MADRVIRTISPTTRSTLTVSNVHARTVFRKQSYEIARRAAIVVTAIAAACSPSTPRDVVPETHDVRVTDGDGSAAAKPGGYAYVARRDHGAVALAGARNIADGDAQRIVDRIADEMEACARGQEAEGKLVDGAARIVVASVGKGNAQIGDMEIAPGGAVAANALLCLVAPIKAMPFALGSPEKTPAILLEATWAPRRAGVIDAGGDL